ncbi:MAG: hypothetical protein ACOYU3_07120 [Bacillota bacterium]
MQEETVGLVNEQAHDDGVPVEMEDAEGVGGVQPDGNDANPAETVQEEAVTFGSQSEFDRVLGKRIEQERRKWQRENETVLNVGRLAMARYEGLDGAEAEKRANEEYYEHLARKLDISPQAAEYITRKMGPGNEARQESGAALPQRLSSEQVENLFREEERIRESMPEFDVVEFAGSSEMVAALIALGYPLSGIVEQFSGKSRMHQLKEQAEQEVIERIRARNSMPAPAGGYGQADMEQSIRMMTDAQIESIDRAVRAGKRVVL